MKNMSNTKQYFNSVLYQSQIPIKITYLDYDRSVKQFQNQELMNITICTQQRIKIGTNPQLKIKNYQLIIQSKQDPFTILINQWDQQSFNFIKIQQNLKFDCQGYLSFLMKKFNEGSKCLEKVKHNNERKIEFEMVISPDGNAHFCILQQQKLRYVTVLKLNFRTQNEDKVLDNILQKYQRTKTEIKKKQYILEQIIKIIKEKNPSFLLEITKKC